MVRRRLLFAFMLVGPPAVVCWASFRIADRLGQRIGIELAPLVDAVPRSSTLEAAPDDEREEEAPPVPQQPEEVRAPQQPQEVRAPPPPQPGRPTTVRAPVQRGIRVSGDRVMELVRGGVRPSGVPVPAQDSRPAGLALQGVGGLGVGLMDGDVLTEVGGQPAVSLDVVVGAVSAAYKKHASAVSGRVFRKGETIQLLVEIPYPDKKRRSSKTKR